MQERRNIVGKLLIARVLFGKYNIKFCNSATTYVLFAEK